ncbi:UvrD-helicase domain-containing protein [uncultured Enterovirga sp.]|uniref:UvrD-helicase domain-containing protein n=1 Tax=uncultured Enterovirga sp. TaxID=2026352 RepID=UPI0035C9B39C
MDAIELGRQRAAEIHDELVGLGCSPWQPLALVTRDCERRDIEISAIDRGSPLLAGARAVFDPLTRSIKHERTGSDFDDALLIAHELGHVTLGDDRIANTTSDVDAGRSAEAAPVGEERVVDYSRKARREVQMDLFARELLLPRATARRLHLHDQMSASAIADRLGAPFGAVAQQLLDALLLSPMPSPSPARPDAPLTARQDDAARHRGAAYLLEAGPGTGKTKTLVSRVSGLVAENEDPRAIVVLTYSNKAAGELADRIGAQHPEAAAAMWIGTFHAFGLNLIRRFHREMGFTSEPGLIDRPDAIARLLDRVVSLGLKHYRDLYDPTMKLRDVLGAISRAQDEVVSPERYEALAAAMARDAVATGSGHDAAEKADEVVRIYRCYEEIKRERGRVDFGDLVAQCVTFLEARADVRQALRAEFRHILVDEYQDVNRASVRLLQALTEGGRNLWCVGDIRQAIYRFRGASSFNLARFKTEDFPSGTGGRLDVNYRSRQEIVDAFGSFAEDMPVAGATGAKLEASRGASGDPVEFRTVQGDNGAEMDALVASIEALKAAGCTYRDQALLCSGNDRLNKIGAGLEARGVPVLYLGNLFERPEVRDLLSWLSLLVDPRAAGLARRAGVPELALSFSDVAAVLVQARGQAGAKPLAWCREAVPAGLSAEGVAALVHHREVLEGLGPDADPWEALALFLLDRTRTAAIIAAAADVTGRARGIAVWQLMNFVRAQPGGGWRIQRLLDRIRQLVLLSDDRDLRNLPDAAKGIDAVRLMTMHGSKGLEFPVVHIPGLNLNTLPRSPQAPACPPPAGLVEGADGRGREITDCEHREEQECLFYVALSRAEDRLILYAPDRTAAGATRQRSPFIARLGGDVLQTSVPIAAPGEEEPPELRIDVVFPGAPVLTEAQLALYERCPRRFFYTHVLETGGRRGTTLFMDMHEVVRRVTTDLAADPGRALDQAAVAALTDLHWLQSTLAATAADSGYRQAADAMISYFVRSRQGRDPGLAEPLRFDLPGAAIVVRTDEAVLEPGGGRVFRHVRTGHRTDTLMKSKALNAFAIAVGRAAPGCRAEIVFLSDETIEPLDIKPNVLGKRVDDLAGFVSGILEGRYPPKASTRTCPNCPAFFICGPAPDGRLEKILA